MTPNEQSVAPAVQVGENATGANASTLAENEKLRALLKAARDQLYHPIPPLMRSDDYTHDPCLCDGCVLAKAIDHAVA